MVAAHKEFPMPADQSLYMPILVGATQNFHKGISYQRDDQGDNISTKNANYSELTATYWAWKNAQDVDAIGLVHYRRYFRLKGFKSLKDVLSREEVTELLAENSIIVPRKRRYYIETNYSHYIHAHHREPLDLTREVIKQDYPEYLSAFDNVMSRRSAHMFNMFIMQRDRFDNYATFVFGVLTRVESRVKLDGYSVQELRVFGYLSELLMDVWIEANNYPFKEVRWGQLGSSQTIKKMFFFLKRKIGFGRKITHF